MKRTQHSSSLSCFTVQVFLCLGIITLFCSNAYASPKKFPEPKWLDSTLVSEQMIINGVPSTVKYFEVYKEIDDLLDFYRKRWNDGTSKKPGYRELEVPPWHVLSRLDGRYLYTVQVQEGDPFMIRGYLAVADLKKMQKKKSNTNKIAKMDGSEIINDVTSYDPGKKGRTLLLVNRNSVASNSIYYRKYYSERGWGTLVDTANEGSHVMVFKRSGKEAHLVITHIGNATQIVMNIIENN